MYGHPAPHGHLQSGHLQCFVWNRWEGERSLDEAWGQQCNDLMKQENPLLMRRTFLSVLKLYMYVLVLLRRFGSQTKRLWITLQGFCHV